MKLSRLMAAGLVLAGLVALWWWWPSPKLGPEEEIRALVADAVEAAERKEPSAVVAALADDFRGPSGASRLEVKQLVAGHLLRQAERVLVLNPSLDVTVSSSTTATLSGLFVFARGSTDQPADATKYQIEATLERRGGLWRITSATWTR